MNAEVVAIWSVQGTVDDYGRRNRLGRFDRVIGVFPRIRQRFPFDHFRKCADRKQKDFDKPSGVCTRTG